MARQRKKSATKAPGLVGRVKRGFSEHTLSLYAAAIAFFAFVALIPTIVATVSVVGLVADTSVLVEETESALSGAPDQTRVFIVEQARSVASSDSSSLGSAVAVSIAAALFSASGAVGQLISALNVIFDHTESRKFLAKRLLALALLLGAIVMVGGM
ncbi:MAG: YhjD/YihY/BrkB family envelope integrity protein, partial [Acidimicrobiales bacterium]